MNNVYKAGLIATLGLGLFVSPAIVLAASITGTSSATVVTPVSVAQTTAMNFGSFAAGTGGTLTLTAADNATGSVGVSAGMTHFGGAQQGVFTVTGTADTPMTFSLTAPSVLTGPAGTGTATMTPTYVMNGGGTTALDNSGNAIIEIGATLPVAADQNTGAYTGTFTITANY